MYVFCRLVGLTRSATVERMHVCATTFMPAGSGRERGGGTANAGHTYRNEKPTTCETQYRQLRQCR
jgi:hypothetical protein